MDQVNTKYCLRKVRLDSLHPSPMGTSVNLYEILLYQNVCIAPCFLCSHPCAPQELGSNSSLELNLSPDHFLHKCPKLQPCLWKEAEAAYAASVPEEAYASGLHRHVPPWEIGWDIVTLIPNCHPFTPTGIASIWNEDGNGMKLCMITMT